MHRRAGPSGNVHATRMMALPAVEMVGRGYHNTIHRCIPVNAQIMCTKLRDLGEGGTAVDEVRHAAIATAYPSVDTGHHSVSCAAAPLTVQLTTHHAGHQVRRSS